MLKEVALIPDIFRVSSYSHPGADQIYLQFLKEPLLNEALVRNLDSGNWHRVIAERMSEWTPRAKELLKKLIIQNRLYPIVRCAAISPTTDVEWCQEALATHRSQPLECIIASASTCASVGGDPVLTNIETICNHSWWQSRSPSLRLEPTIEEYIKHLRLISAHSNSIMLLDPNIDPLQDNYSEFYKLLNACNRVTGNPIIEIHRKDSFIDSTSRERICLDENTWHERFENAFRGKLVFPGDRIKVFIWSSYPDRFHDRYLISNLIGISLPEGFAVFPRSSRKTTWTRLGRGDRDSIQRDFDIAYNRGKIKFMFSLA